jgi:hypothetical protein
VRPPEPGEDLGDVRVMILRVKGEEEEGYGGSGFVRFSVQEGTGGTGGSKVLEVVLGSLRRNEAVTCFFFRFVWGSEC